jgi:YtxH-like protein
MIASIVYPNNFPLPSLLLISIIFLLEYNHFLTNDYKIACTYSSTHKIFVMNTKKKIITAAAVGVATGSVLGVLFAPAKGKDTRKKIQDTGKKISDEVKTTIGKGKEKLKSFAGANKNATIDTVEPFS